MVMVHVDSSAVLAEPMKRQTAAKMMQAYLALLERLPRAGFVPKKYILDIECSEELKEVIQNTCKLQLIPLGSHRANLAEVTIKAFEQHFLSILAGTAIDLPLSFWHELLPQTLLTLPVTQIKRKVSSFCTRSHVDSMITSRCYR